MPKFLDTTGNSSIAIFICARCKMKRPIIEAQPDPNFPGLIVCQQGCADEKDPYRLPARKTERINLRYPRPDVTVADTSSGIVTANQSEIYISTENGTAGPQKNGNTDIISPSPDTNTGQ